MEHAKGDNQLVSVIVPLYNGGKYIEFTLESILCQSYDNFEILVVDDGSTDDGPSKVSGVAKDHPGRIRLLHHPDGGNHWIAASRNLAIRNAKGTFIAFVDQDDLWLPGKLEKQVESLQSFPEAALVYAKTAFIDQRGSERVRGNYPDGGRGVAGKPQKVFRKIINENFIPTLTVLARKTCVERVGLLDEGPRYEYEDWLFFSKIAFFYEIVFIPEILAKYRWHDNNYSTRMFDSGKLCQAEEHYTVTLFSYLKMEDGVSYHDLRKPLQLRILLFFLRARSWGVSAQQLELHALNLMGVFPLERFTILTSLRTSKLLHTKMAEALRRIRRVIVGSR